MTLVETPLPLLPFKRESVSRGFGLLEAPYGAQTVQLPLQRVDVRARVVDRFVTASMDQIFRNTLDAHLEATYVFPLPGGSVVSRFEMHVAGRVVRGVVEERGQARRQYDEALRGGKRAALLEKERDNVFTVAVGNIAPHEEVRIVIVWSERLPFFDDGATELRLPLVVAPRYIPGAALERDSVGVGTESDTDVVPDASRISPPLLADGFDPKTALSIRVELCDSGFAHLACSQHATQLAFEDGRATVSLAREGERLNRDFILRWRIASETTQSRLWVSRDGDRRFGALSIVPPKRDGFLGAPRDVVFLVDRSGSMGGPKMGSATRACAILMSTLGPRDRYAIQLFDDRIEWCDPSGALPHHDVANPFVTADEAGLEKGERFLRNIDARGGTELFEALSSALHALDRRTAAEGRAAVIVLLTDGQIGDESRVLKTLQRDLGDSRVFTVGIDTAVNDGFLKRLAAIGGGTSTFVTPGAHLEGALQHVGREIGEPLVFDLEVSGDSAIADTIVPAPIPDLFAGRASVAYLEMKQAQEVRVRGRHADGTPFDVTVPPIEVELAAIPQLWARARIADLEDRVRVTGFLERDLSKARMIDISRTFGVLCRYTAFVLVDDEVINAGGQRRVLTQAIEMPAEWSPATPDSCPAMPAPHSYARAVTASSSSIQRFVDADFPGAAPAPARKVSSRSQESVGASRPAKKTKHSVPEAAPAYKRGQRLATDSASAPSRAPSKNAWQDAERDALLRLLDGLRRALEAALTDSREGRRPAGDAVRTAAEALRSHLATLDRASELAALQRVMRTVVVAVRAALDDRALEATQLVPLLEKAMAALDQAIIETRDVTDGNGRPFWEEGF